MRRLYAFLLLLCLPVLCVPHPVRAQASGLDLVLLIDSSGSTATSDPDALRVRAAEFLLDYVQAVGETQGVTYRFAAANFSTTTGDAIPWTGLEGDAWQGQLVARSSGGTDFGPALDHALALRRESGDAATLAVVIFTDGEPDRDPDLEAYFAALEPTVGALRDAGAEIYVVAVGTDAVAADTYWQRMLEGQAGLPREARYRRIDDLQELAGIYRRWFSGLLGLSDDDDSARSLQAGQTTTVHVEPYLERLIISVFREAPDAQITVLDAAGELVSPAHAGGSVYAVDAPSRVQWGDWHVTVDGSRAQVWVDRQYATLTLETPSSPLALGDDAPIIAQLWRAGAPVAYDPDVILRVDAEGPEGKQETLPLTYAAGRYEGTLAALILEGDYALAVSGRWGDEPLGARFGPTATVVSLFPIPEVAECTYAPPQPTSGHSVTVTAVINNAARVGDGADILAQLWRGDVKVGEYQLQDDGNAPDTQAGGGYFVGIFQAPEAVGLYRLRCSLGGFSRDGVTLDDVFDAGQMNVGSAVAAATPTPTVTPTVGPTPTPPDSGFDVPDLGYRYPWLLIGLAVGAAGIGGYLLWQLRMKMNEAKSNLAAADAKATVMAADLAEMTAQAQVAEARLGAKDLIKQARHSLTKADGLKKRADSLDQQGKTGEAQSAYRDAQTAYDEAMDELTESAVTSEKAVGMILEPTTAGLFNVILKLPEQECRDSLSRQAATRVFDSAMLEGIRLADFARCLAKAWPDTRAIGHLYRMMSEGMRKEALDAICGSGQPPLSSMVHTLMQCVEEKPWPQEDTLGRVADAARALPGESGLGLERIYTLLSRMAHSSAYPYYFGADPDENVSDTFATSLAELHDVLRCYGPQELVPLVMEMRKILHLDPKGVSESEVAYYQRVLCHLTSHLASVRALGEAFPEVRVLGAILDKWLIATKTALNARLEPADIRLDIVTPLSTQGDEILQGGVWQVTVPICLRNVGQRPARNVRVILSRARGCDGVDFRADTNQKITRMLVITDSQVPDRTVMMPVNGIQPSQTDVVTDAMEQISEVVSGESAVHMSFRLQATSLRPQSVRIQTSYEHEIDDNGTPRWVPKGWDFTDLAIAPSLTEIPNLATKNPYTVAPLLEEQQWQSMGLGEAKTTISKLLGDLRTVETNGRFFEIKGMRRTGKTTILRRTMREIGQDASLSDKFSSVYIDLRPWWNGIEQCHGEITDLAGTFWHELLFQIYCQCTLDDNLKTEIDKRLGITAEKNPTGPAAARALPPSIDRFNFMVLIGKVCNSRLLLLILDEGDVFAEELTPFEYYEPAQGSPMEEIALGLRALAEDRVVVILGHGYGKLVWETAMYSQPPNFYTTLRTMTYETGLLSKSETLRLAQVSGLRYTALGQMVLWVMTGGYPLLVQLLSGFLFDQKRAASLPSVVSAGDIKQAISTLNTTSDGSKDLDCLRADYREEERVLLRKLATGFTDEATGFLRGIRVNGRGFTNVSHLKDGLVEDPALWLRRLLDRAILETDASGAIRWRVGWLYLLMSENR